MAWLNAVPRGSKNSRLKSFKERDEDSPLLKLPKTDGAEYLVDLLYEAGLFESNGMAATALSWQEIQSWLNCTKLELTPWEIMTIKDMSNVYVAEFNQASAKDRPAPYLYVDELKVDRDAVEKKLRNVFQSLKRK